VDEDVVQVGDVAGLGVEQLGKYVLAPDLGRLAAAAAAAAPVTIGALLAIGGAGGGERVVLVLRSET
jgi:hypothetical protein